MSDYLTDYWHWLDNLDPVVRYAILLEDKEGFGRLDPDFKGQTVCYILDQSNDFEEFWSYLEQIDQYTKTEASLFWNIYMKGMSRVEKELKKNAKR